jgi:uncharacterized membrane protein
MKRLIQILRATVVGGVLFLAPFVVLIIILGKAQKIMRAVLAPVAERIPIESVIGLETPKILAAIVLVLICFFAGLFARTSTAKKLVSWLETVLLSNLPGYSFIKNLGGEIAETTPTQSHKAVLVRFDDAWQIGFLVESIAAGRVVVFIPDAPSPWTGGIFILDDDRVTPLEVTSLAAIKCVQRLGAGTGALVKGLI